MRRVLLMLAVLAGYVQFAEGQPKNCQKFRTGYFKNIDEENGDSYFKRTDKYQYEKDTAGTEIKLEVIWINDCSYKLRLVKGNEKWNEKKHALDSRDLIVTILEVGEDYYLQVSRMEGIKGFEYKTKIQFLKPL